MINGEFNIFEVKKSVKSIQHKDDKFLMEFGLSSGISGFVKINVRFFIYKEPVYKKHHSPPQLSSKF